MDVIDIEILADGTIKSTAGKIGAQNHQAAEAFLTDLAKMTGGKVTRKAKGTHSHGHAHGEGSHEHSH
jgi:hypothetical protein